MCSLHNFKYDLFYYSKQIEYNQAMARLST